MSRAERHLAVTWAIVDGINTVDLPADWATATLAASDALLRTDAAVERVARAIGAVQYGDVYLHLPEDMHSADEACMHCLDLPAARAAIAALLDGES